MIPVLASMRAAHEQIWAGGPFTRSSLRVSGEPRCRERSDEPYPTERHYDVVYGPVAKRWWGPAPYTIIEGYDQTSFHGNTARVFLNDRTVCKVEVVE